MNKEEALKIVGLIKVSFPHSYKDYTKNDFLLLAEHLCNHFKDVDYMKVYKSVNDYIDVGKFPPTIADIKSMMFREVEDNYLPEEEVWEMIKDSARCDYAYAEMEYDSLPLEIQNIITINTLVEIGRSSDESLQFIKRDILNNYKKQKSKRIESLLIDSSYTNNLYLDCEDEEERQLLLYESNEDRKELPFYKTEQEEKEDEL